VYDPDGGLVTDIVPSEDAHQSERAAVGPLLDCVFRRKAAGHSDASQSVIPTETSHPFRGKPATPDPG